MEPRPVKDDEDLPNDLVPPEQDGALMCMAVAQMDPARFRWLYYNVARSEVLWMYALQRAYY